MAPLHIYDPRERMLVGAADRVLRAVTLGRRRQRPSSPPQRVLLLRLERIGDLLMTLPAIAGVRRLAPAARLDLVVGGWNRSIAEAIPGVDRVRTLDARWLARDGGGLGLASLMAAARAWRAEQYDLAINFEPDIRSNLLVSMAGARWTAGYRSAGGGPLLDLALDYDVTAHTGDNAMRLVATVFDAPSGEQARSSALSLGAAVGEQARQRLGRARRPLVGIHASGGRAVKQWEVERFAQVARRLIDERDATIVLTGSAADRPLVDRVKNGLPGDRLIDLAGDLDLIALAAVLERLDLYVTGDTGPMHLATAVGTPVVAIFGPSDPARYGPRGAHDRIVRVDLPCSPCNRIRLPPARCTGHTPDCLALVTTERVATAALAVLDARARQAASGTMP